MDVLELPDHPSTYLVPEPISCAALILRASPVQSTSFSWARGSHPDFTCSAAAVWLLPRSGRRLIYHVLQRLGQCPRCFCQVSVEFYCCGAE